MQRSQIILFGVLFLAFPASAQQKDQTGCTDHPLFTRMPTYWIHHCTEKEFDAYEFTVGQNKKERVEGRFWSIFYYPQATAKSKPSELQILRNFESATQELGGKVVWTEKSRETFEIKKDGKEFWVEVSAEFTGKYGLKIVEKKGMAQDIVANAEALSNDLRTTGHAAVYGIYFDTGESDLKPESEQAVGEIGKLLKKDVSLKVYVVGHTDNVGGLESNMELSQDRAEAVMQVLVKVHGIAASRMKAFGNGPYAPVSTNDTDEGKTKNRRVELVKQ
ncbi:MAG: yiaD 1 [Bacteroidetes bacterium]|jgi:outer membrane protein OmpA-like peptidoglycan-associated protein|nr:yiaD 1 [Bacteroidota bacterium]